MLAAVASRGLKDGEKLTALANARRFIVAWGLERADTATAMRFLQEDPFMNFAKATK